MSTAHADEIENLHEGYSKDVTELEERLGAAEAARGEAEKRAK